MNFYEIKNKLDDWNVADSYFLASFLENISDHITDMDKTISKINEKYKDTIFLKYHIGDILEEQRDRFEKHGFSIEQVMKTDTIMDDIAEGLKEHMANSIDYNFKIVCDCYFDDVIEEFLDILRKQ